MTGLLCLGRLPDRPRDVRVRIRGLTQLLPLLIFRLKEDKEANNAIDAAQVCFVSMYLVVKASSV